MSGETDPDQATQADANGNLSGITDPDQSVIADTNGAGSAKSSTTELKTLSCMCTITKESLSRTSVSRLRLVHICMHAFCGRSYHQSETFPVASEWRDEVPAMEPKRR
jgi:hypothetical protein